MLRIKCFAIFLSTLFSAITCFAQTFGANPSGIKWKQINTDTVRIIFPAGLEASGNRVAYVIHEMQKNHTATIGNKHQKINIVLQNQPTLTNGYVGQGPYRSEFYLFAPQNSFDLGAQNWADLLSLHEYRHVQQFSNFNVGVSKAFSVLFGQEGRALANAITIPDWFFEGDAVLNETVLSEQGRGRLPQFFNGYQALFRDGKKYSYMKLRNGSYRDFVPNHYPLGYMLVSYGRQKYGEGFWRDVTRDAARLKPIFYRFQGAVKKHSGKSYKQFVQDAMKHYNGQWQTTTSANQTQITSAEKNNVVAYQYPQPLQDGSLLVLKTSYRSVPAIYQIDRDGSEKKIITRSIANDDYFSYKNGKIVFASLRPDARWGYREFSNITLVDVETKNIRTITRNKRFFSPDISNDVSKIAAVEMNTNQSSHLVVLNVNGEVEFSSKQRDGIIYTHPKFSINDQYLYSAIRNIKGQMALIKINIKNGEEHFLTPFHNAVIGFPFVSRDTIYYTSSYRGADEVWAHVEGEKQTYRLATNTTGLYQPVFQQLQKRLVASNFTANGYQLLSIPGEQLLWQPINYSEDFLPDLYVPALLNKGESITLENIPTRNFTVDKYRKSFNLLNFHSWRPDYSDPEFSFTVYGQNILNTFQSELAYTYNQNERSHKAGAGFIYGGWYVQPTFGISETWGRTVIYNRDTSFNYNEFNTHIGARLPLNFSAGKQFRSVNLSSTLNNQQVRWTGLGKQLLRNSTFNYVDASVSYTQQIQKAIQHIFPRFAQTFFLQHKGSISKLTANQTLANTGFYFPGLHVNHNLVLKASFHRRDTMNQYRFSSAFPFSRGFLAMNYPQMVKLAANYHLPLVYPDWGFGNIVYFNRIRLNGFYDHTIAKDLRRGRQFKFASTGGELFFDTKWWNQQEVAFGVRYSYLIKSPSVNPVASSQWEIILPVHLVN